MQAIVRNHSPVWISNSDKKQAWSVSVPCVHWQLLFAGERSDYLYRVKRLKL